MTEERRHPLCAECDAKIAAVAQRVDLLEKDVRHNNEMWNKELAGVHARREEAWREFKAHTANEERHFTALNDKIDEMGERIHDVLSSALNDRATIEKQFGDEIQKLRDEAFRKFVSKETVRYIWLAVGAAVGVMLWINHELQVTADKAQTARIIQAIKAETKGP